ncbi:MAG TPA: hypothetical protein VD971_07225 [Phycisphaerales bacterium]|nr:hypothetical protein [Phycisphaerales bacterium]
MSGLANRYETASSSGASPRVLNDSSSLTPRATEGCRLGARSSLARHAAAWLVGAAVATSAVPAWGQKAAVKGSAYGCAMAVDGNVAVVGSWAAGYIAQIGDQLGLVRAGGAHFYDRNASGQWVEAFRWTPNTEQAGDRFGHAVAIRGGLAAIGGLDDCDAAYLGGAVYVIERINGAWTQGAKLTAAEAARDDHFGRAVAIGDNMILIGADYDDDAADPEAPDRTTCNSGSVYVFERSNGVTWVQTAKITAPDAGCDDHFGFSLAASGGLVFVGAPLDDDGGRDAGAVYVYERVGGLWTMRLKLHAADAAPRAQFGFSLAARPSGGSTQLAVGSPWQGPLSRGAAYLYNYSSGAATPVAQLSTSDTEPGGGLGFSVALDDGLLVAGAPLEAESGLQRGAAFVATSSGGTWGALQRLNTGGTGLADSEGLSVGAAAGHALVGVPSGDAFPGSNYLNTGLVVAFDQAASWAPSQTLKPTFPCPFSWTSDWNGNGKVGLDDDRNDRILYQAHLSTCHKYPSDPPPADLNGDGVCNEADLLLFDFANKELGC